MCNGCNISLEYKAYYSDEGEIRVDSNSKMVGDFKDFKEKNKE